MVAGVGALAAGGLALAQAQRQMTMAPRSAAAVSAVAVDQGVATQSQIRALQGRMLTLEHKVTALQATVGKIQPALSFRCVAGSHGEMTTSMNSLGVAESCVPYACAPIDGRCISTARTSADCAPGYAMAPLQPGVCIAE